jgi:purine-nucleoside phosphorylase
MAGRVHLYEGRAPSEVVFPVRVLARWGARTLIVTNSAGGIRDSLKPGDLMLISDHINLQGVNPLGGANEEELGPRFPDMTHAYDPALRDIARTAGAKAARPLQEGVYAAMSGPSYETPAEIRMLRTLGADAVGMSTAPEVIAARHMGLRVLGISCISNLAAGISGEPLTHQEVTETAARVRSDFEELLVGILREMGAA